MADGATELPMFQNSVPCSKVELSVSCRNLADMDVFSKSDPMCVLFAKELPTSHWFELGRTEVIYNTLNPDFVKKFSLDYFFEQRQFLKFEIYDVDCRNADLTKHDFLGRAEFTLGEIVSSGRIEAPLKDCKHSKSSCIIVIASEELSFSNEELTLELSGRHLDKKDLFGKSDPFVAVYRVNEDRSWTVVHRTEVVKRSLNPTWKTVTVTSKTICGGDRMRSLLFRCFDWNRSGTEKLIGEFTTNLQEVIDCGADGRDFELVNPAKTVKSKYKNSGVLHIATKRVETLDSFLDFIRAGTQLNCTFAIDFTASNGNPATPVSLHYLNPNYPNQYHLAIQAVGEIIKDYDSDQMFPVLGFGARIPPEGRVSHEFFVNGSPTNPFCTGISGVLDAYHRCLLNVQLYGPTNFAPVINHVARFAASNAEGLEYFILVIITDGIVSDLPQTKAAIVAASALPISIIIVGVGMADFTDMHVLDGDIDRLSYNGRVAERDIVQFVAFRDFLQGEQQHVDHQVAQFHLAKEVLAEIPDQFLGYMKKQNLKAKNIRSAVSNRVGCVPSAPAAANPAYGLPPPPYESSAAAALRT